MLRGVGGALAVLLLFAAPAPGQQTAAPRPPLPSAIENLLRGGASSRPLWDDLRRLYGVREYRPLWEDAGLAAGVVAVLENASTWGLRPDDYRAAPLRAQLSLAADSDPAQRAAFDVALSEALLRFVAALHGGRVEPSSVGADFAARRRRLFDRVAAVEQIATGGDLAATLAALQPRLSLYRDLLAALRAYRELAVRAVALPPLGDLPKLHPGDVGADLFALRAFLALVGDLPEADRAAADAYVYDPALVEAVRRFQRRHGLDDDGIVGAQTSRALAVPLAQRVTQIELNLERLRWPAEASGRLVLVNIPEFSLRAYEDPAEEPALEMKVVVGSAARQRETIVFAAQIRGVNFRPYWNVPRSITRAEMLPRLERDPSYLARNELQIVAPGPEGSRVLALSEDAVAALRAGRARLRQQPGARNSLGLIKFLMPNRYNIYLHDTPSTELFRRYRRDFSHGCIRVEKPVELAAFALGDVGEWDRAAIEAAMQSTRSRYVTLPSAIPVWIDYLTAVASADGRVAFLPDIYDRDEKLARLLR